MPTKIYESIIALRQVFTEYAKEEGGAFTLTKGELAKMIRKEVLLECDNKAKADDYLQMLDTNKDDVIDFQEYMNAVTLIAVTMFTPLKTE